MQKITLKITENVCRKQGGMFRSYTVFYEKMRIINQKRNVSIELENYDLMVDENNVVALPVYYNGANRVLGTYGSEERAMEVLSKIHSDYKCYRFDIYEMPIT